MKLLQLDGSEGGGQILRSALSLAMITGQPFRMTHIRGKRSRPGLMRQHLTCVKAACAISDGTADGAEIGSTELVFRAGRLRGGEFHVAIGTAGSTGLLFQTLLPALLHADAPSTLVLEGGTHNPLAPPFEFLDRVFLPALRRMGAEATLELITTGFAPAGGGVIRAHIQPCGKLQPLDLTERAQEVETSIRVISRNIPLPISGRMLDAALKALPTSDAAIENREDGPGAGICCLVESSFGPDREITSDFGAQGITAERVAYRAAKSMREFLNNQVPVGRHLADQLLLPLALAGGGRLLTMKPDNHVPTNLDVISKFLPIRATITNAIPGKHLIEFT